MKEFWENHQINIVPWIFLTPALLMFGTYVVYPIIQSAHISFYAWDGLPADMDDYVGFGNYIELWEDDVFWTSLKNNVIWVTLYLVAPPVGLAIALLLNQTIFGIRLIKALFFFPFVISQVVVGLIFSWFYDPNFGLLNIFLQGLGFSAIAPLSSESGVTFAIIVAGLWPQIAYCMILYLTGLNSIDKSQIEAGMLDGCSFWQMLQHVVIPQLKPATFIAIVVTVIGSLRSFDLIAIMTQGGPYDSSSVLAFFMYDQALTNYRMGYGAAIAVVLFLIMSVYITYFLTKMIREERR